MPGVPEDWNWDVVQVTGEEVHLSLYLTIEQVNELFENNGGRCAVQEDPVLEFVLERDPEETEMPTPNYTFDNLSDTQQATIMAHVTSRTAWVNENAGTALFLIENRDRNTFYRSVYQSLVRHNSLTAGQASAIRQDMGRVAEGTTVRNTATYEDLPWLPNGKFSIEHDGEHISIQIHTPIRGSMAGKRLVKRNTIEGFKAFAFIMDDGSVQVWRRFADLENTKLVEFTRKMINFFKAAHNAGVPLHFDHNNAATIVQGNDRYIVWMEQRCRRCNRALSTPQSVQDGIGPECSGRNQAADRTVAARQAAPAASPARAQRRRPAFYNPTPQQPVTPAGEPLLSQLGSGEVL